FERVDCKGIRDQVDDFKISGFDLRDALVGQTIAYELQKLYRARVEYKDRDAGGDGICVGECGETVEAKVVFEEMKEGGLKPRTRTYNVLLKGLVNMGSLSDPESIVTEMERGEVIIVALVNFGGVMFMIHFLLKNRVNKVIKDQEELTYLARVALKTQKLIKEIDAEGSV
ncbi:hypothetical protein GIB67_003670, partial [Kingdonia uniflora]